MVFIPNKKSDKIEDGAGDRINHILGSFNMKMLEWDLENAYWLIRRLRGNVYRKLGDAEKAKSTEIVKDLEKKRQSWMKDKRNQQTPFFEALEDFEIFLTSNLGGITSLTEDLDDDDDE